MATRSPSLVGPYWPDFGLTGLLRSTPEAVRVAVHLAGIQMFPYRSSVVVMLACPMISWSIFGGYQAWTIRDAAMWAAAGPARHAQMPTRRVGTTTG